VRGEPAREPWTARIAVVGSSCAGKTTLARELASRLGAPHVELDALHWGPDWTPRPTETFRARVAAAVAAPRWVCDGNYSVVQDLVWPRATAVVWLDYGFPRVLGRALRRTLRRSLTGEELYAGNRESLRKAFLSRDSILLWVVTSWGERRRRYGALAGRGEPRQARWLHLRHPRELAGLWREVEAVAAAR